MENESAASVQNTNITYPPVRAPTRVVLRNVLAFMCAVVLVFVLIFGIGLIGAIGRVHDPAENFRCASDLRQIGSALSKYAELHNGLYPPTLDLLVTDPGVKLDMHAFSPPSGAGNDSLRGTSDERARYIRAAYVYEGRRASDIEATRQIIAWDVPHHHKEGTIHMLFGDGHVEGFSKEAAAKMLTGPHPFIKVD